MKNLIITADDYGVYPGVNEGVIEALKAKKINSTSVLSNYEGSTKYLSSKQNLEKLLHETGDGADIGCHLTLTSGRPITGDKMSFACDSNGVFLDYANFKNFTQASQLKALETELCEQIEVMHQVTGFKIKHLTNHHNSLTLFPQHFEVYLKVAKKFGVPMRSANVIPEIKQNIYIEYLNFKLRGDNTKADRKKMKAFSKEVVDFFNQNSDGVKAPADLDSRHYGPAPFMPTLLKKVLLKQKQNKLDKYFEQFNSNSKPSSELLMHLYKKDSKKINTYTDLDYPGVDPNYFDSRSIEFESIMAYDISKWSNIKLLGWDFL